MSNAVPEGYHSITPYLQCADLAAEIAFLTSALGGEVTEKLVTPDGVMRHAEVRVGDSKIMCGMGDPTAEARRPMLYLYVADCDASYAAALKAGAESVQEPADQPYGDRSGAVVDPSGVEWWISTRVETLSVDEMAQRMGQRDEG